MEYLFWIKPNVTAGGEFFLFSDLDFTSFRQTTQIAARYIAPCLRFEKAIVSRL